MQTILPIQADMQSMSFHMQSRVPATQASAGHHRHVSVSEPFVLNSSASVMSCGYILTCRIFTQFFCSVCKVVYLGRFWYLFICPSNVLLLVWWMSFCACCFLLYLPNFTVYCRLCACPPLCMSEDKGWWISPCVSCCTQCACACMCIHTRLWLLVCLLVQPIFPQPRLEQQTDMQRPAPCTTGIFLDCCVTARQAVGRTSFSNLTDSFPTFKGWIVYITSH